MICAADPKIEGCAYLAYGKTVVISMKKFQYI